MKPQVPVPVPVDGQDQAVYLQKKIRAAVYDSLVEKGIDENNRYFRTCFKKLIDIVKLYAQEMTIAKMRSRSGSVKAFLATLAKSNVDTVVNLNIAIGSASTPSGAGLGDAAVDSDHSLVPSDDENDVHLPC